MSSSRLSPPAEQRTSAPTGWRAIRVRASRAGAGIGAGWSVRRHRTDASSSTRFVLGVVGAGVGTGLVLGSGHGANSWDVLGVALASSVGVPLTAVFLALGLMNLTGALLLGERPGASTLVPTLIYGPVVEATVWAVPEPQGLVAGVAMFAVGFALVACGAGAYLTAGHRPGPVDLLFRGMAAHGVRPWQARLSVEGTALFVGVLLGGPIGVGTAVLTVGLAFAIPAVADALPAVRSRRVAHVAELAELVEAPAPV